MYKAEILTIDDVVSEGLKLLKSFKSAEQITFLMIRLCVLRSVDEMSALTQNKFVNTVMEYSHAQGPWFAPQEVRHQALSTVGIVFPEGHTGRVIINYAFRALHPQ